MDISQKCKYTFGNTPQVYMRPFSEPSLTPTRVYLRLFSGPRSAAVTGQSDQSQASLFRQIAGHFILANRRAG
jgi:hypothetical protein